MTYQSIERGVMNGLLHALLHNQEKALELSDEGQKNPQMVIIYDAKVV